MNRRSFLKRLGIGVGIIITSPQILFITKKIPLLEPIRGRIEGFTFHTTDSHTAKIWSRSFAKEAKENSSFYDHTQWALNDLRELGKRRSKAPLIINKIKIDGEDKFIVML